MNTAILWPDVGPLRTRLGPLQTRLGRFRSEPDLNGPQTSLPELSKRTPLDPIRTLTDSALDVQVQSDPLQVRLGPIKSVPERWTSLLDFKMKVCAKHFLTLIRFGTDFFCSQRTFIFPLSPIKMDSVSLEWTQLCRHYKTVGVRYLVRVLG